MTDKQIIDLFAEGTAPELDPAFAIEVAGRIGRARLRIRFFALARRVVVMLMLTAAMFVTVRLLEPVLAQLVSGVPRFLGVRMQLVERIPQFMGVPIPMVLAALVAGLVLCPRFYFPRRRLM